MCGEVSSMSSPSTRACGHRRPARSCCDPSTGAEPPGLKAGPDTSVGASQDFNYSPPPLWVGLHAMPGLNPIEVRKSLESLGICPQDCA